MIKPIQVTALLIMLVTSASLFAQSNPSEANDSVHLQQLAQDQHWRQLLGYASHDKSAITSSRFFISPNGHNNPHQELLATLNAFAAPPHQNPNEHSQCRFPGRYLWLSKHVDFNKLGIQPITCPAYLTFSEMGNAKSVSVIFATGYLGNPASYYGHLLLKINAPNNNKSTDLESTAINFGANIPPNENMLFYITKGIIGGYGSSFTHQQYFYHSHNYGESELRDLWEYELDIDPDDLALLIAHQWELIGMNYVYYFFNRNCAYRMGELLQLISKHDLVNSIRPWETPQAIVQRLGSISYKNRPLVKTVKYHPSRQSRLYQRYGQLTPKERQLIHTLVNEPQHLSTDAISHLTLQQQFKILDTLIDYYQFVRKEKEGSNDPNNEYYRRALSARYLLPPGGSTPVFSSANQPHMGRKPSYLNIGGVSHKTLGDSLNIWLRPAYYDSLDAGYGHIKNASLAMGELKFGVRNDKIYIRELNIVKIESLRRNFTGLPGDKNSSWYLEVGAEQQHLGCDECLATKIRSGYGYSSSILNDHLLLAGFSGAGFFGRSMTSDALYVSGLATMSLNLNNNWSMYIGAEQRYFNNGDTATIHQAKIRKKISQNIDMRLYFAKDEEQETGLSIGFYW